MSDVHGFLDGAGFGEGSAVTGFFEWNLPVPQGSSNPSLRKLNGKLSISSPGLGGNPSGEFRSSVWDNSYDGSQDFWSLEKVGLPADFFLSSVDLEGQDVHEVKVRLELGDASGQAWSGNAIPLIENWNWVPQISFSLFTHHRFEITGYRLVPSSGAGFQNQPFWIRGPIRSIHMEEKNAP